MSPSISPKNTPLRFLVLGFSLLNLSLKKRNHGLFSFPSSLPPLAVHSSIQLIVNGAKGSSGTGIGVLKPSQIVFWHLFTQRKSFHQEENRRKTTSKNSDRPQSVTLSSTSSRSVEETSPLLFSDDFTLLFHRQ